MSHLTIYLDLESISRFEDPVQLQVKSYISNKRLYQTVTFQQAMFPTKLPWPVTLAPTNEAIRRENCAKKTLIRKKINCCNPGGH
jgi:hypothetical protein